MRAFDKCKSNIRVDSAGQYPLDKALLELYNAPEVVFHLLPTPGGSAKRAWSPDVEIVKPAAKAAPKSGHPSAPKKIVKKTKVERTKVRKALKGFSGVNKDKLRVCYNYNLPHGCANSTHEKDGHLRGCHGCIKCGGLFSVLRLCGSRQVVAHCRADERIVQMQLQCPALGSQKWSGDHYVVQSQVRPKRKQKQEATKRKPHKNTKKQQPTAKQGRGP